MKRKMHWTAAFIIFIVFVGIAGAAADAVTEYSLLTKFNERIVISES